MKSTIYLIANSRGVDRITKKHKPTMHAGEVAVKLTVEIHDANFHTPMAEARLVVDDSHVIQPKAEVTVEDPPPDHDHEWKYGSEEYEGSVCTVCGEVRGSGGLR